MRTSTFGRNLLIGIAILMIGTFVVLAARAGGDVPTPQVWISGYVLCLDGTPIQNASVKVTYCSDGNNCNHPELQTYTNAQGYYSFLSTAFQCRPDYGVIKVTKQFAQTQVHAFNYVPFSWTFNFFCGHFLPHQQTAVEVNQSTSHATAD
jgi:hypothetical protein